MTASAAYESEVGTIADYRLVRSLGRANNGELFLARTPSRLAIDTELVMVKVLDGATPSDTFRRATRELRAFAAVHSPFLVTLYDAGQEGERLFYAMEYMPLGSLARPRLELTEQIVMRAGADAARAAHALHEAGIAHGDIQPANVLLSETGGKLGDLGLARVIENDPRVTGVGNIGAVEYMDPRVLRGVAPSRASDIWALGATVHRALTGVGVYGDLPEHDPLAAIRRVLASGPVLSPSLSEPARAIVERCLRPTPAERYGTAEQVAAALDRSAR